MFAGCQMLFGATVALSFLVMGVGLWIGARVAGAPALKPWGTWLMFIGAIIAVLVFLYPQMVDRDLAKDAEREEHAKKAIQRP